MRIDARARDRGQRNGQIQYGLRGGGAASVGHSAAIAIRSASNRNQDDPCCRIQDDVPHSENQNEDDPSFQAVAIVVTHRFAVPCSRELFKGVVEIVARGPTHDPTHLVRQCAVIAEVQSCRADGLK